MTKCKTSGQTINTSTNKIDTMNKIVNHSQLMQLTINLKEPSWADASYDFTRYEIRLNIDKLTERSNFHHILHHIFILEHDYETSHDLDNIAKRYKEYWLW